ncbi:hotdog fold thioesterase [Sphingorhabdus sp. IMCC26285]|jgi:1,4-dihydroxy-2-naphthoyl-CoA hydrolase|uniref:Hotdog fold thioesterase n=1 Tax=Sphingorhabdus profundilacus TaxID=2509718 RepID=A0A6I4LS95_9SPHN|nr:hotdog fold thioesterase [Sphingorhabdus profundilacus]MVZ96277.1 hotdog fold thioesterase [Sphingorhabdus profundilacus]
MTKIWFNDTLDLKSLTANGDKSMPGYLGIEFIDFGDDWIKARMPVDERTKQPYGRLHGGASVVLAETIGSVGAAMTIDQSKFAVVGMEINANHIRPVKDGYVYAVARAESMGRTTQIWSIRIEDEAGKLVCISRITMAVISTDRA